MNIKQFEEQFPIGTKVRYYSVKGSFDSVETTVRSKPWVLGHGMAVVSLEGISGGVSIDHVKGVKL